MAALPFVCAAALGSYACGTDPVGVDTCRRIEHTRCEVAPSCPEISLERPVHRGDDPESDVGSCKRYYDDACLHGMVAPEDPGGSRVQACVDAIRSGDCAIVAAPEKDVRCSFLIPPPPPAPPAADAASDAAEASL
jgi:hypothetical protein